MREVLEAGIPRERVIVVDGGSTDGTPEIARSLGVKVVRQRGTGKALAIKSALDHISTEYVAFLDGDYTYPARHLKDLCRAIEAEKASLAIGVRARGDGLGSLVYRFGNWVLTRFFNAVFGARLRDVLSGMYVAKTESLRSMDFEMGGFSVESEIAAHIAGSGESIAEAEIEYRRRRGRKKLGVAHGVKIAVDMVRLAWRYNPVFLIFMAGSLLLIPGLALGAWVGYHYFFTGVTYYVKGIVAVILTLAGFQSLLLAVLALYIKRMEIRISRKLDKASGS